MARAHRAVPMDDLISDRLRRLASDPGDAASMMDLALVLQFYGRRDEALAFQRSALRVSRLYADPSASPGGLTLLCLMAPGDLTVNTPMELILGGRGVNLLKLYLMPDEPLPDSIPDHDAALVAISAFDETRTVLARLAEVADEWPRPLLNHPGRIDRLSRDGAAGLLQGIPGLAVPETKRMEPDELVRAAKAEGGLHIPFPLIVRPVGSHGGKGLTRVDDTNALADRVSALGSGSVYIAPFVDYRSADGFYRKLRIALIERRPYLCHVAIADRWMVSYDNAGMERDAGKRREEERTMQSFDHVFVPRHGAALAALADRLGLDYVVIDCAETRDGRLLFFEADNAAAVHDLDPPDVFPYKRAHMRPVFDAFEAMLRRAVGEKGWHGR